MMLKVAGFCLTLFVLLSCGEIKTDQSLLPPSTGKYGEVIVVVDTLYENRKTGKQLQEIFYKQLPGLPQAEPQFRMSTVNSKSFKSILKRSRNILRLNIGNGKKTNIAIEEDVWAKDQLLINITAGSDSSAARILSKNISTIRSYFNEKEIERLQKQYSKKPQKDLMEKIERKFNIGITIPPAYVEMSASDSSMWLKKEKSVGEHIIMQGISIYIYPYESDSVFAIGEMISCRDRFTQANVWGERDSSYMVVYEDYKPTTAEINLADNYAVEYRGLWNMKNDFMGGPFLHYTFVDQQRKRVINLDAFVYAPKFDKREYLREMEALLKTVSISH